MIVCSCNVFRDHQVRSAVTKAARWPRMSQVYACLGCGARCGRCAGAIKRIMDETLNCATASVSASERLR
jgi:bacterioferritin-associated ferredoxin